MIKKETPETVSNESTPKKERKNLIFSRKDLEEKIKKGLEKSKTIVKEIKKINSEIKKLKIENLFMNKVTSSSL